MEAAWPMGVAIALRRCILLPTIYTVDSKVVLGRFIQRWSGELTRIDDVAIPCLLLLLESLPITPPRFLGRYSCSPYIRHPDPLLETHLYIPYASELHNFKPFVVVSL